MPEIFEKFGYSRSEYLAFKCSSWMLKRDPLLSTVEIKYNNKTVAVLTHSINRNPVELEARLEVKDTNHNTIGDNATIKEGTTVIYYVYIKSDPLVTTSVSMTDKTPCSDEGIIGGDRKYRCGPIEIKKDETKEIVIDYTIESKKYSKTITHSIKNLPKFNAEIVATRNYDGTGKVSNGNSVQEGTLIYYNVVATKGYSGVRVTLNGSQCNETSDSSYVTNAGYDSSVYTKYDCSYSEYANTSEKKAYINYSGGGKSITHKINVISVEIDAQLIVYKKTSKYEFISSGDTVDEGTILNYYVIIKDNVTPNEVFINGSRCSKYVDSDLLKTIEKTRGYIGYVCAVGTVATSDTKTINVN